MLSLNNGYERLSKEYLALTEISKTLTSPLELSDLLDAVMKKIVDAVAQADIGSIMLGDQPAGLFRPVAVFGLNSEIMKEILNSANRLADYFDLSLFNRAIVVSYFYDMQCLRNGR